ncbi:MAG TPA: PQQ-binding-like beta-propeller repeat protein [Caulifigura sp.]|nr:PQQ-binding-like beta-propeller repeat protein [Caulifigura sp.]
MFHSPLLAGDWPQWRGPVGDGHAPDEQLADSWPESGPPVLWSRELGQGYSAFVVANDRAYTQAQSLYDQTLLCLDANTGATLWTYKYGWTYEGGGLYPGPRATPAIVDGLVYFAAPDGLIGCVDAQAGSLVWSTNFKERYAGKGTDFGVAASPMVWNGKLIIPVGGAGASVIAVDAKTGRELWKCGDGPASYATPLVVPFEGRSLAITPLENSVLCVDAETGGKQWELELSSGYDEHSAAPVYREPMVMFAGPFRSGARSFRIVADGPEKCRLEAAWESNRMSNDIASSVLVGDVLLGFDLKDPQSRLHRPSRGLFRGLDWTTGRELWSSDQPGHANSIVADGKLLLFNDRGELRLGRTDSEGYRELAKATVLADEVCWTPPALSNGRVFLRSQSRAVCVFIGRDVPDKSPRTATLESIPKPRVRFDPTVLLGGEREFPAATPELDELGRSYLWTMGLLCGCCGLYLLLPGVLSSVTASKSPGERQSPRQVAPAMKAAYWFSLVAAGAVASAVLNPRLDAFVFTWPLAVWALMQFAVERSVDAVESRSRSAAWQARGAIVLFALGCGAYFHACRLSGLATEWAFLTGFAVAGPVAVLVRRGLPKSRGNPWLVLVTHLLSYSTCFWAGVAFMKWKTQVGS